MDLSTVTRARVIKSRLVVHDLGMTVIAHRMGKSRQWVSSVLNDKEDSPELLDRIEAFLNERERKSKAA